MTVTPLPFYHSTVFTTERPESRQESDVVETYYHDGYEKQYTVINRDNKNNQHQSHPVSSRRRSENDYNEYRVRLENGGHSYFKIGASEGKMKVVQKTNNNIISDMVKKSDYKQRELRKFPNFSVQAAATSPVAQSNFVKNENNYEDYDEDDYDHLIRQGTITEFCISRGRVGM